MSNKPSTEQDSNYDKLDEMSVRDLLININREDHSVPQTIAKIIPQIEALIAATVEKLKVGGRLFYIGAGTSGRLGIVDASECPPTFGVPHELVIGLIAGGDTAIRRAVEFAEDDENGAWNDLQAHGLTDKDVVVGIAASGTTPYVVGALKKCRAEGIITGGITCNSNSPVAEAALFPIEAIVGPEFVTGSTRMKAGTAQKLILNMISTATMIQLGKVKGNKMVDMQLSNNKLVQRGTLMIMEQGNIDAETAKALLLKHGSVREALKNIK
ncbi:MAG: N-acetylmuramic acid 6-phosphate etherase [Flavobacteriales bacterium]|nr:N-acetylmuramic acid 6-phosphate etherase [Flavobacteriales bacterium]